MSASSPQSREEILEANLRALFRVAYHPLPIRAGLAAEVQRAAAAALDRPAPARPRLLTLAIAAAASFLIAAFAVFAWQCSDQARDRLVRQQQIALREGRGGWNATLAKQLQLGGARLELALPEGAAIAVACGPGALAMLGPAHASIASSGSGADVEAFHGGFTLRGFDGRVRGEFGSLECSQADLDLACSADGSARAWLSGGLARFESRDGQRRDLVREQLFDTRPARPAASSLGSLLGAARVDPDAGRQPIPAPSPIVAAPEGTHAVLSGKVHTQDGTAIQAFRVILLREVELPQTAQSSSREFADPSGRFRFESAQSGEWTVFVQASGFALWTRNHVRLGTAELALDVALEPGAGLSGRVVEAGSARPLANVLLVSESDVPCSLLPFDFAVSPDNPAALTRTDAEGRFHFEHLASSSTVIRAQLRGFASTWSSAIVPGASDAELAIEMTGGGALAGRVEREDGSAWVGAGVVAMPQRTLIDLPRRSYGWGMTDAGGAFLIEDLPPGDYVAVRVEATRADAQSDQPASARTRTEVREVRIRAGATARLDFLASPRGSRLAGRVLRADRTPFAAGTISIMPALAAAEHGQDAPYGWRSQLCGADGSFEFTEVVPGRYDIFLGVRTPMDTVGVDSVEVGSASNVDHEVVAPAGEIAGRVSSAATGRGVSFAAIVLEREGSGGSCEFIAKVFSDESGEWRIPFLVDGRYRLRAYPGQGLCFGGRDGIEVRAGAEIPRIDFALEAGSELALAVRDERGLGLGGIEVRLIDERGLEFEPAQDPRTDAEGRRTLPGLPTGRLRVVLRNLDGSLSERWISTQAPEPAQLEMTLPRVAAENSRK
ncbi:MAG TPA: carboxypeptidase-like regulatory domain-containing protein [Planctomycetota bacterium]|nr:carboxypeptidase-like regulatory domain-containing protein [Planctomycetota bacterium]